MAITKKYWTYAELRTKLSRDLDIDFTTDEDTIVSDEELKGYVNEAIDRAEQEVITIYEDYFLTKPFVFSIVSGQEYYPPPPNIYADKIRRVILRDGSRVYKVTRIQDWHKFEVTELDRVNTNANLYSYYLVNNEPADTADDTLGVQLRFTPVPRETSQIFVYYIRQANRIEVDADILDIPEAQNYILQYCKKRIHEKEVHGEMTAGLQQAIADLSEERLQMVSSLNSRVPDAENNIEPDFTSYEEHS